MFESIDPLLSHDVNFLNPISHRLLLNIRIRFALDPHLRVHNIPPGRRLEALPEDVEAEARLLFASRLKGLFELGGAFPEVGEKSARI